MRMSVDEDQGAVAITAAVSMVLLFAATALAVDVGMLWAARRGLITATDAAALAAAREYAIDDDATQSGCGADHAPALLADNAPSASLIACTPVINATSGYVTVTGRHVVDLAIGPAIGTDTGTVDSTTTVRWGQTTTPAGLRPFGLCVDANPTVTAWLAQSPTSRSDTDVVIEYGKGGSPTTCGSSPGNWGLLDFNGGANGLAELRNWVQFGYEVNPPGAPAVRKGTAGLQCATEPVALACVEGDTGALSPSISTELAYLRDNDVLLSIPLFDHVTSAPGGGGANAEFHIVGFVQLELEGFKVNGADDDRFLDVELKALGLGQGTCCDDTGVDGGLRTIQICGVDPGDTSQC